jgi:hypothetical protein
MADEAVENLRQALKAYTGDPREREDMLNAEQREVLTEHVQRVYHEYRGAVLEEIGENGPAPDETALDQAAMTVVFETLLAAGYDLGLEDGNAGTVSVELPADVAGALLSKALRERLED